MLCAVAAGGSGFGSQSMRSSGGSGVGRYSHGHNSSAGSAADWGSGNYSPTSAGRPPYTPTLNIHSQSKPCCSLESY